MIQLQPTWPAAPSEVLLTEGEIHVWRANLESPPAFEECRAVLSADELIRAARFHFADDARRFIATRGAVRMILSRYLGVEPSSLIFDTGPHGKPYVLHPFMDIRFNVSHSQDIAVVAVTRGRDVGVDVEFVQPEIQFEPIAEHYFDPRENWDLRTAPAEQRASKFFSLWTQKEARLKAEGVGLVGEAKRSSSWGVRNLCPAEGYAGAIASEGEDWKLAYWEWSL